MNTGVPNRALVTGTAALAGYRSRSGEFAALPSSAAGWTWFLARTAPKWPHGGRCRGSGGRAARFPRAGAAGPAGARPGGSGGGAEPSRPSSPALTGHECSGPAVTASAPSPPGSPGSLPTAAPGCRPCVRRAPTAALPGPPLGSRSAHGGDGKHGSTRRHLWLRSEGRNGTCSEDVPALAGLPVPGPPALPAPAVRPGGGHSPHGCARTSAGTAGGGGVEIGAEVAVVPEKSSVSPKKTCATLAMWDNFKNCSYAQKKTLVLVA